MDSCWNWESFAILDHNRRKAVHHIPLSTIKSHRIIQPHWQTVILHGILKYSSRIKWKWFSAWIGHFKEDLPPNNPRSPHLPLPRATQAPPATSTVQQSSRHNRCLAAQNKVMIWSIWLRVPINVLYFTSSKTFAKKTFIFLDHCIAKWLSRCVGQDLSFEPSMETTVKGQQNRLQIILHKSSKTNHF